MQLWLLVGESGSAGVQQILSTYVFIAVAVMVYVGLVRENLRATAGVAVGLGLGMAFLNSVLDQYE